MKVDMFMQLGDPLWKSANHLLSFQSISPLSTAPRLRSVMLNSTNLSGKFRKSADVNEQISIRRKNTCLDFSGVVVPEPRGVCKPCEFCQSACFRQAGVIAALIIGSGPDCGKRRGTLHQTEPLLANSIIRTGAYLGAKNRLITVVHFVLYWLNFLFCLWSKQPNVKSHFVSFLLTYLKWFIHLLKCYKRSNWTKNIYLCILFLANLM